MDRWQATRTHDELAQHAEWLRGLARALVGDAAVADDLAQDAWLAFGKRALDADSTRPFLARVVRRLASKWRRGEGRRVARERDASRDEHVPSPDETLERLETQELLVRALKGLPEPYRGTLMLRYFDGFDAAEIARRTGVPAGTVRSRIARGLEELRGRLDAHSRGDRREWMLALLPIANPPHIAAGAAATTVGVIGAMSAKWIAVSAALVLVALLVWMIESSSATRTHEAIAVVNDTALSERAVASEDGVPPTANERTEVKNPESMANAAPATLTVVARFVDYARTPIEGVALRAFNYRRASTYGVPGFTPVNVGDPRRAVSDTQGRVELKLDRASILGQTFRARASARGWTTKKLEQPIDAGDTIWLGDVELEHGGAITGRVIDAAGAGVKGAQVYAELSHTDNRPTYLGPSRSVVDYVYMARDPVAETTDTSGAFELDGLTEDFWTVWVLDIGRAWVRKDLIAVSHERSNAVILQLGPPDSSHTIAGRVLDPDGNPAVHIPLSLRSADGGWDSELGRYTRSDGSFETFVEDSTALYTLSVSDAFGRWAPIRLGGIAAGTIDLDVSLVATPQLTVHVVNPDGEVIEHAQVSERTNGVGPDSCTDTSDREGIARLRRLDKVFSLAVEAEGCLPAQLGPLEPTEVGSELTVRLERAPSLRGRVTSQGRGIEGAKVEFYKFAPPGVHLALARADRESRFGEFFVEPRPVGEVSTGRDGSFARSSRPDPFRWYLLASASGFASVGRGPLDVAPGVELGGLDIELVIGGAVEGVVSASLGGSVEGFGAYASNGLGCEQGCTVGPDGRYRIEHLAPGKWQVRAFRAYERTVASGVVMRASREPVTFDVDVRDGVTTRFDVIAVEHESALVDGRLVVRVQPGVVWRCIAQTFDGERAESEESLHVSVDGRFHCRSAKGTTMRIRLTSDDPRWQHAEVVDSIEVVEPRTTWSCEFALAHVSGWSATLRDIDVDCVRVDSSTRRVATRFHLDAVGRFDAFVPAGRVTLRRYSGPDATAGEELLTLNNAEGADERIELP